MTKFEKVEHYLNKKLFSKAGFILYRHSTAVKAENTARAKYLQEGSEIGILQACRFAESISSTAKFKQFSDKFGFIELNEKYPFNPIIEKPYEQV